jgi:hypothetical protein
VFFSLAEHRSKEGLNISGYCEIETLYVWILLQKWGRKKNIERRCKLHLGRLGICQSCRRAQVGADQLWEAATVKTRGRLLLQPLQSGAAYTWGHPLQSDLGGQGARSSLISSPDHGVFTPFLGKETDGQERQAGPRSQEASFECIELVRAHASPVTVNYWNILHISKWY